MAKPLRVLIVEDDPNDEVLLLRALARGFDVTSRRVETPAQMSEALAEPWDIVISDFALPKFTGPAALALMKERGIDLPFIIVSGTVDEESAVEAMRAGANDFMAKGKFARLIPAIERELRDAVVRADRHKMQEQLLISDRMASLGTLAAGVAHEINNPLAALMANVAHAAEEIERLGRTGDGLSSQLGEIQEPLRDARESAERIRLIVRDLKALSRSDEETRSAVDVRRVIDSCLRMAWNEIRHRARVVKDLENVPPVAGNEARLGQVFVNLFVNAAQAIPEGHIDENEIRVSARQDEQGRVVVEVRDTGAGIPEAALPRIFDPFFTTKPIGTGTGLGLAICHRIVTESGGQIQVESQLGKGTVVRLILPAAQSAAAVPVPPPAAVQVKRGRILIVDDEPMLATALKRMLSAEHDVLALNDAREALTRIAQGEKFDVILCDLMMPDMTGMDLHSELTRASAEQTDRMVFMSGGVFTAAARDFLARVPNRRIDKPFDAAIVRALVQEILSRNSGS